MGSYYDDLQGAMVIENCAVCGGIHLVLVYEMDLAVMEEDGTIYTNFAYCPITNDCLLVTFDGGPDGDGN